MAAERTRIVTIRFTDDEYDRLLAEARGEKLSKYVRRRLLVIRSPNSAIATLGSARESISKAKSDLATLDKRLQILESDIRSGNA